jgi:hypothetical protein
VSSHPQSQTPYGAVTVALRRRERIVLRVWHRLLSAGTGDVADMRGWSRLIIWRGYATPRERLHAVKVFLKLPPRAAREAYREVQAFGRDVAEQSGISRRRQFLQLLWLGMRYGTDALAYLDYQLYRPDRFRRAGEYVRGEEFRAVVGFLHRVQAPETDAGMLVDKRRFEAWCHAHGFPTAMTLLEVDAGGAVRTSIADGALPPYDLFSKPADLSCGEGTGRWIYVGNDRYLGGDGRVRTPAALREDLAETARVLSARRERPVQMLLQKCLHTHPELAPLTSGALPTIRLLTYRWPRGTARLLFGAFRLPTGNAQADNFHLGAIVAPVDLRTERLGPAIQRRRRVIHQVERHPDTGARIEGHHLPFVPDAIELVLRAHVAVRLVPCIGWDVALTDTGPVLVEGNDRSDPDIAQAPTGIPLGETPFVRCINAHVRECLGL